MSLSIVITSNNLVNDTHTTTGTFIPTNKAQPEVDDITVPMAITCSVGITFAILMSLLIVIVIIYFKRNKVAY